ncbi:hypothetical protein OROMI_003447 [Orobanche minor]
MDQFLEYLASFVTYWDRLTGTFPEEVSNITTLETLALADNLFEGNLLARRLHNLMTLQLSANNFDGTIPETYGNLRNLMCIYVLLVLLLLEILSSSSVSCLTEHRRCLLSCSLSRLKLLDTQAKELSETEASYCNTIVRITGCIIASWDSRATSQKDSKGNEQQKRKRVRADSDVFRLSPSMRSHLESIANLKGEQVAAIVSQEDAGGDEELDEEPGDDEESGGKYRLPMTHIKPFPRRTDLSNVQDFPPRRHVLEAHVLAVYPETTALYKATVV